MHHSLRFYSRNREQALRLYIFLARWTRLPLVGWFVRLVGNAWGRNLEGAYVLTASEAEQVIDAAGGLALGPCTCRQVFANCDHPIQAEIMLGVSGNVFIDERSDDYRRITKDEAKEVIRESHRRGLVHSIIKCRDDFYSICNCCTCCCVPLRLKQYGIGNALVRHPDVVGLFRQSATGSSTER